MAFRLLVRFVNNCSAVSAFQPFLLLLVTDYSNDLRVDFSDTYCFISRAVVEDDYFVNIRLKMIEAAIDIERFII